MTQDIADMLDLPVERPDDVETTARGASMLAATGVGLYRSLPAAAEAMRSATTCFEPRMDHCVRKERLARWQHALTGVLNAG